MNGWMVGMGMDWLGCARTHVLRALSFSHHRRPSPHHTTNPTQCPKRTQVTKTSLMLGVGEAAADIRATLRDLRNAGCDVVTFGQYLRPTKRHMPVREFVTPEAFAEWQREAEGMGFKYVASGPLVRSSYKAGEFFLRALLRERQNGQGEQPPQQEQRQSVA
jgi:lipoate synthase